METENKDWKPEVGGKAWIVWASTFQFCEIRQVVVGKEIRSLGATYFDVSSQMNGGFCETKHIDSIFPTIEKAQESFEVYDLEGKEVVIPPRPLVLEPKPLEWRKNTNDFNEHLCEDDYWTFSANSDGSWVIFHGNAYMGGEDNPTDGLSIDDAKAAIQEWRGNQLKSMLP